jgi:hypothetical protein
MASLIVDGLPSGRLGVLLDQLLVLGDIKLEIAQAQLTCDSKLLHLGRRRDRGHQPGEGDHGTNNGAEVLAWLRA